MKLKTHYDAVIVGSGHNGLIAAAYLARAGMSVLVLERNESLGGATASQRVFPDYDAWLSRYAYLVSLLPPQIIADLGLTFQTRRRRIASFTPYQDSAGVHRGLLMSNVDESASRESMRTLTGSDSEWRGFQLLQSLQTAIAELIWPTLLQPLRTRSSFRNALSSPAQKAAWEAFIERPLGEILEACLDNDVLRGLVMTDGKIGVFTHPHDESLLQNRCFLYHVIGNGTGEWRVPVGGMRALVDGLVGRCRTGGVTLITDAAATAIQPEAATGSHTVVFVEDGIERHVDATRVLVNAGPKTFARLIGETWNPIATDEGSVMKMNILLQRLPRVKAVGVSAEDVFAGSLHLDEGYGQMQQSFLQASRGVVPDPAPAETYCHTLTDDSILSPELRARGFQTLTLFGLDMPYRLFTDEHDARRDHVQHQYLQALNRICAEPIEDCIARDREGRLCIEIKTPQDLEREVDLSMGNIFHNTLSWFFAEDDDQAGRWGVETHLPGIYRAGSSAARGGAVSGIPGHNAAMCILEELKRGIR